MRYTGRPSLKWLFEQDEKDVNRSVQDESSPSTSNSGASAGAGQPNEKAKSEAEAIVKSKDVTQTVNLINQASPEAINILASGQKDGNPSDDQVNVGGITPIAIGGLVPTQNYISIWKSVAWPLSRIDSLKANNSGDPTGRGKSIVVDGNLVIDGHHRWSSVWGITGPGSGKIFAQQVTLPGSGPMEKLAKAQIAIVGALEKQDKYQGKVPSAAGGDVSDNILGASPDTIKNLLMSNIGKSGLDPNNPEPLLGDKYMAEVVKTSEGAALFGLTPTDDINTARTKIIDKVAANLASLPKGQGPARELMPQFDDDAASVNPPGLKFKDVAPYLKSGDINVSDPAVVKEAAWSVDRWQVLAGIKRRG